MVKITWGPARLCHLLHDRDKPFHFTVFKNIPDIIRGFDAGLSQCNIAFSIWLSSPQCHTGRKWPAHQMVDIPSVNGVSEKNRNSCNWNRMGEITAKPGFRWLLFRIHWKRRMCASCQKKIFRQLNKWEEKYIYSIFIWWAVSEWRKQQGFWTGSCLKKKKNPKKNGHTHAITMCPTMKAPHLSPLTRLVCICSKKCLQAP